jgi:Rod binding domain-containing protein
MSANNLSILPGANGPLLSGRDAGLLANAAKLRPDSVPDGKDKAAVEKAAKDFEAILVQKLVEEMKNTVPDSPLAEDGASKQMQDLFWLYLGQQVGQQGGLGLWKQMVRQLHAPASTQTGASMETLR